MKPKYEQQWQEIIIDSVSGNQMCIKVAVFDHNFRFLQKDYSSNIRGLEL